MPNYTYVCQKCRKDFSLYASFDEYDKKDPKKFKCTYCGSTDIKQKIGNVFFINGSRDGGGMSGCGPGCGPGAC